LLVAGAFVPRHSAASELTRTNEVHLKDGAEPRVIVRTHDDGFIIAGQSGWAARTDADGKLKWRYVARVDEPDRAAGHLAEYYGAAIMPDDSVFLCGSTPRPPGSPSPGLLTHLDKDGQVLSEQQPFPDDNDHIGGNFSACAVSSNGLVAIGLAVKAVPNLNPTINSPRAVTVDEYYWIVGFDADGKKKWEKREPIDKGAGSDEMSLLANMPNGDTFITGVQNEVGTEVLHVRSNGQIAGKKLFKGETLTFVHPVVPDTTVQLISYTTTPITLISLDHNLQEMSRVVKNHEIGGANTAFRLPGQSFVLFGAKGGHNELARVMTLDPTLEHAKTLYLEKHPGSSSWVTDATPIGATGQFACVREDNTPANAGAVLTFVTAK
jgi:hypothetical protein